MKGNLVRRRIIYHPVYHRHRSNFNNPDHGNLQHHRESTSGSRNPAHGRYPLALHPALGGRNIRFHSLQGVESDILLFPPNE